MNRGGPHFTIRLDAYDVSAETAYRLARICREILEERAPAGIAIEGLEFHDSRISKQAKSFSKSVRAAMRDVGERERRHRLRDLLEQAAELVGEDIEVLE